MGAGLRVGDRSERARLGPGPARVLPALPLRRLLRRGGLGPPQPNASGLRANHQLRRFEDDLDDDAIWIGVSAGDGGLVALTRIIDRRLSGALELERYIELPSRFAGPAVIEGNRVAVRRSHRATLALTLAQLMAVWTAHQRGAHTSIGAARAKVAFGPAAAYGWEPVGIEFRYHPADPEPVHLIYCDLAEQRRLRSSPRLAFRLVRGAARGLGLMSPRHREPERPPASPH